MQIPRQVLTNITAVTEFTATCAAPSVYGTDITDGTSLSVTIVPPTGGAVQAQFNTYTYVVNSNSSSVPQNFSDSTGTPFAEYRPLLLLHPSAAGDDGPKHDLKPYRCRRSRARYGLVSASNKYCIRKFDGTIAGNAQFCLSLPAASFSAQSYYFNLYIQENAEGNINLGNSQVTCPQVKESLNEAPGNLGTQDKPWPLDTTFALSQTYTSNYTIGIAANTVTANGADATSQSVSCAQMQLNSTAGTGTASPTTTPTSTTASSSPFVSSCLGFAAPTATNGSCGKVNGLQTYRLRRYFLVYPPIFDTNGTPLSAEQGSASQLIDTIYVLDRPVTNPADPSAVITMLGPKPCPQAYFDGHAVTGANGYYSTSNSAWTGKNVDGIHFPNVDSPFVGGVASCSATLPIVNAAQSEMSAVTINASNPIGTGFLPSDPTRSLKRVYVRPVEAWGPHYVEDTSFQASRLSRSHCRIRLCTSLNCRAPIARSPGAPKPILRRTIM